MRTIRISILLVGVLGMFAGQRAYAQATTGTPPLGSFGGGGFDIINLDNLDVHFCIPIVAKAGRGLPFNYSLCYDSLIWYPVSVNGVNTWTPVTNWGWRAQTDAATGYLANTTVSTTCYYGADRIPGSVTITYQNWTYYEANGTTHPFTGLTQVTTNLGGTGNTCPSSQTTSLTGYATDDSGYYLSATGASGNVTGRNGAKFNPLPINVATGSGTVTDRNGNELSVSSSGVYTDTLGSTSSTPLTITGTTSVGTSSSPTYYKYYSPSGQVAVTMSYKAYTVHAQFGCGGYNSWGPSTVYLVDKITLPDGTYYAFAYEADYDQTHYSGDKTGRIASVTLPTGGTISYNYTGDGENGIFCFDGSTAGFTRVAGGETWSYTRPSHTQTTVQDPAGDQEVLTFSSSGYETQREVYNGAQVGGTLLEDQITCYNNNTANCPGATVTAPITQRAVSQNTGSLVTQQSINYNNVGLPTVINDYDWGASNPSRVTQISYASLSNGILDRPSQVSITDGTNTYAKTTYTYDEGTPQGTSGTPQHTSVTGSRGNATTVSYLVTGSTTLTKHFSYYDTGNVYQATDVNGAVTTFSYTGSAGCGNSFLTGVTLPVGGMTRSEAWNCTGGVVTSTSDENGQPTSAIYTDANFWRPFSMTDPLSNTIDFGYSSTAYEYDMASGNSWLIDSLTGLDGLGRPQVQQHRQDTGSGTHTFDSVETDYDSVGRPTRVTMPYVTTTIGGTNASAPATTTTYDLLNRPTKTTDANGGYTQYTYYYGPTAYGVLTTVGPSPGGQSKEYQYDGLGRLTSVCEVTSASGSGGCLQTQPETGLLTTYVYNPLNKITTVTQNAQVSTPQQTRSFTYDDLGRMLTESNPETKNQQNGSHTTTYTYDATPSGCLQGQTAVGDLATKADQNGNTTSYCYDLVHRLVSVLYSGPNTTHCQYFQYDSATVNGVAMSYAKSRLAEAYTTNCNDNTKITDEGLSYNARGELTDIYESTPNSGGYYHISANYWPHGVLETLGGLTGLPNFTFAGLDGEGRVTQVQASSGQNPILSSANYNFSVGTNEPLGALAGITLGSGDSDSFQYDTNTGRQLQYQFKVNNQSVTGNLSWNTSGTLSQLQIIDPFNSVNSQNCSYSYDDLARVSGVNCGTGNWNQNFYYASSGVENGSVDAFGNITKTGSSSFQATYDTSTNHFSLSGINVTYDNDGNLTYDGSHNYTWNAAGRPTAIDSLQLTYDAFNRLVEINNGGGSYTQVAYAPTGAKLALMNGQTLQKAFVGLPGGATAVYNRSGLAYYRHADWLGSSRLASTPGGGAATPHFVQANSGTPTSAQTVSVALPNNQTAGNMNIVVVGWNDTTSSVTSVTDTNGNGGGSGGGSATFIQKVPSTSCSGLTCTLTVAATGGGHILTVVAGFALNTTIASVSGGGTWVCPSAAVAANGTTLGSAACYVLSSTSGATSVTITLGAAPSGVWVAEFREYSITGTPVFDTSGEVSENCTSCSGVTIALGGTNDLIVQMINPAYNASAVSSGWTDAEFPGPNYFGAADELGTSSGAAPTWTTSGGNSTGSALAFNLGSPTGSGYTLAVGPTTVGSGVNGGAITESIYYVPNIKGGSNTVTVQFNQSATYPDVRVLEYSGLNSTNPLDVIAAANGSSTSASSGSATTTSASELIFGANTVFTTTKSAGTGFTSRIDTPDGDIAEDEDTTTTGSYSATATLNSSGNWVMQMATFKAATTTGTSVYADVAYAPYGESYAPMGAADASFTGQNNDTVGNLYDFLLREYHPVQGRWISPDPAGILAVDPVNPQTWNRYAYVVGSPLDTVDPLGLCNPEVPNDPTCYLQTQQPWLTISNFGCWFYGTCNVPSGGDKPGGGGSSTNNTVQTPPRPTNCNGVTTGDLNYNAVNPVTGETGQEHIETTHMALVNGQSPIPGKSQYLFSPPGTPAQNWNLVMTINAYVFTFGNYGQAKNGNLVFTKTLPPEFLLPGYQATGPRFLIGMQYLGKLWGIPVYDPTDVGSFVTRSDCKSVVTSYPGQPSPNQP